MLKVEKKLIYDGVDRYGNDTNFEIETDDSINIRLKNGICIDADLKDIDESFFTIKDYDSGKNLLINYDEVDYIEQN